MNEEEFKNKYPQYTNLEGDELWDKMIEILLSSSKVLIADPNRTIAYHEPIELQNGNKVYCEDSSKTIWLNDKGERVKLKSDVQINNPPTESYGLAIIDFSNGN